jgi:hypothetical protein
VVAGGALSKCYLADRCGAARRSEDLVCGNEQSSNIESFQKTPILVKRGQIQNTQMRNPEFLEHAVKEVSEFEVALDGRQLRLVQFLNGRPVDSSEARIEILVVDRFPDCCESLLPVAWAGLLCKSVDDEGQEESRSSNNEQAPTRAENA